MAARLSSWVTYLLSRRTFGAIKMILMLASAYLVWPFITLLLTVNLFRYEEADILLSSLWPRPAGLYLHHYYSHFILNCQNLKARWPMMILVVLAEDPLRRSLSLSPVIITQLRAHISHLILDTESLSLGYGNGSNCGQKTPSQPSEKYFPPLPGRGD